MNWIGMTTAAVNVAAAILLTVSVSRVARIPTLRGYWQLRGLMVIGLYLAGLWTYILVQEVFLAYEPGSLTIWLRAGYTVFLADVAGGMIQMAKVVRNERR